MLLKWALAVEIAANLAASILPPETIQTILPLPRLSAHGSGQRHRAGRFRNDVMPVGQQANGFGDLDERDA